MTNKFKRNKPKQTDIEQVQALVQRVQALASVVSRPDLFSGKGLSYDGERDLYEALGYKDELTYSDYINIYAREGTPKRVNDAPCNAVWKLPPIITDKGGPELSPFELAWEDLAKEYKVWNKFNRADKLLGFGPYSILYLGLNDVSSKDQLKTPVKKGEGLKLLYIQCYSSEFATIKEYEEDPTNPRYGLPLLYKVRVNQLTTDESLNTIQETTMSKDITLIVHWSRVVHLLEDNLQNETFGEPRLRNPYNRLSDIQKIVGGSAEMYWRGAKPGYVAAIDKEARWDVNDPTLAEVREQLEEYEHNLRRILYLQGIDMKALEQQISSPLDHLDAQYQDLAAGTRIPKRILTGSERGELASSEDRNSWMDVVQERRESFGEPIVVTPFVDRMIEFAIVPEPVGGKYNVTWPDLRTLSDEEKAKVGETRMRALKEFTQALGGDEIIPIEKVGTIGLGLDAETVRDMNEIIEKMIAKEEKEIEEAGEEEEIMEGPVEEEIEEED